MTQSHEVCSGKKPFRSAEVFEILDMVPRLRLVSINTHLIFQTSKLFIIDLLHLSTNSI